MTHQTMTIKQEPCSPCPQGAQPCAITSPGPNACQNSIQPVHYAAMTPYNNNTVTPWDTMSQILKHEGGLPSTVPETKARLKDAVLRKRHDLVGIDTLFEERKPGKLSKAEMERRERRKDQNRRAARKCRIKKREEAVKALLATETLVEENERLNEEIVSLHQELETLQNFILDHQRSGLCQIPQHFQNFSMPMQGSSLAQQLAVVPQLTKEIVIQESGSPGQDESLVDSFMPVTCHNVPGNLPTVSSDGSLFSVSSNGSLLSTSSNGSLPSTSSNGGLSSAGSSGSLLSSSSEGSLPTETIRRSVEESIQADNPVLPSWDLSNITPTAQHWHCASDHTMEFCQEENAEEISSCVRNLTAEFQTIETQLLAANRVDSQSLTNLHDFNRPDSPSLSHCISPNLIQQYTPNNATATSYQHINVDSNNNNTLPGFDSFLYKNKSPSPSRLPQNTIQEAQYSLDKGTIFSFDLNEFENEFVAHSQDPTSPFLMSGSLTRIC